MIGKTIGHYEILEKIGSGGMGDVYRARDTSLNRDVAIKFLPKSVTADEAIRERFKREAQAAGSLNHPNIITIHELGEHDERMFIVMELVEGQSLRQRIKERPLSFNDAIDITIQLAEGLSEAHASDITHRDIKPDNIIIDKDGRCRLLDFGLAQFSGVTRLTQEATTVGTVFYMSPEQTHGGEVDRRTDIWSLGVLLYEMIAGDVPFKGEHITAVGYAITTTTHEPLTSVRTGVPKELERIVDKMLAKKPEQRYQTVDDVMVDLRAIHKTTGELPAPKREKKRTTVMVTAAVVVLAVIAWWLVRDDEPLREIGDPSVAVLPFANMSADPDNEYFSDGLSEELLNVLARVQGLRVAARTSSFQFKGHTGDVSEIGEQLNVSVILEGSVRRSDDQVRITVQLISADDGFHIWSHTYDREMGDIFAIQEDIANRVVEAMRVTLLGDEATRIAKQPTDNLEAYDAYLLGKHQSARRTGAALAEAVGYFEKAIELDPDFTLAYVGLADTYVLLESYGNKSSTETITRIEPLLEKALQLDDQLGETYASLAWLHLYNDRAEEARSAYERAIELSPSYATAYHWYGLFLGTEQAQPQAATAMLRKAAELDPLSPIINQAYAADLADNGRFDEALARYDKVIAIDSDFPGVYDGISSIYYDEYGRPEEALPWLDKAIERDPGNLTRRVKHAQWEAVAGRVDEAIATYDSLAAAHPNVSSVYSWGAWLHRALGQLDKAYVWRHRAAALDPEDKWLQLWCVMVLGDLGLLDTAEEWARRLPPMTSATGMALISAWRLDFGSAEEWMTQLPPSAAGMFRESYAYVDLHYKRYATAHDRYAEVFPLLVEDDDPKVYTANLGAAIMLAAALIGTGETERAEILLEKCAAKLESFSDLQRRLEHRHSLMEVYALQGRIEDALAVMRSKVDAGIATEWSGLESNPNLAAVHAEPEYQVMITEMKAEAARQAERVPLELLEPLE